MDRSRAILPAPADNRPAGSDGEAFEPARSGAGQPRAIGQQFDVWQAVYGPVGDDGYPKQIWDKATGTIDHSVACTCATMATTCVINIETNWRKSVPDLVGKLHFICGDMDDYYLNLALYDLEDFLENRSNPAFGGPILLGPPGERPRVGGNVEGRLDQDDRGAHSEDRTAGGGYGGVALQIGRRQAVSRRYSGSLGLGCTTPQRLC